MLEGAARGGTRDVEAKLGSAIENPELRGATIPVKVLINDLKRVRHPELNEAFFDTIGLNDLDDLRDAVSETLKRKIKSEQRQACTGRSSTSCSRDAVRASGRPGEPRGENDRSSGWSRS